MPDHKPSTAVFEVYHTDQFQSLNSPPYWKGDIDPQEYANAEPIDTYDGWDDLSTFLEENRSESSDGDYIWEEVGGETAPEHELCPDKPDCDARAETGCSERLSHVRDMHHIGTGH